MLITERLQCEDVCVRTGLLMGLLTGLHIGLLIGLFTNSGPFNTGLLTGFLIARAPYGSISSKGFLKGASRACWCVVSGVVFDMVSGVVFRSFASGLSALSCCVSLCFGPRSWVAFYNTMCCSVVSMV